MRVIRRARFVNVDDWGRGGWCAFDCYRLTAMRAGNGRTIHRRQHTKRRFAGGAGKRFWDLLGCWRLRRLGRCAKCLWNLHNRAASGTTNLLTGLAGIYLKRLLTVWTTKNLQTHSTRAC